MGGVLTQWMETADERLGVLGKLLTQLGLTRQLEIRQISETQSEVLVDRYPVVTATRKPDMVNVADVGSGVSEVLPALVALLTAETGQMVYLEEPEANLHPRAQSTLAQVLTDSANRGVRVVVETHSSLLLLGIQSLVAKGKLDPGLVALHWFSRDKKGATMIASAELDRAGRYGDWPEDFAEVELDAEQRFLDASFSAMSPD